MTQREWNAELIATPPLILKDLWVELHESDQIVELTDTSMKMTVALSFDQVQPIYDWLGKVLGK